MLTPFQQAVVHCLTGIDQHAHLAYPWPGPTLLAALRETPIPGHPDPTARDLRVVPAPAPHGTWDQPGGPVAVLRQAATKLHSPVIQATFASQAGPVRLVAWVFMHATVIIDDDYEWSQVRYVDAVDLHGATYNLTRRRGEDPGPVVVDRPDPDDSTGVIDVLRSLARMLPRQQP